METHAPKAVFLSYASQDAQAAQRIADVLSEAGVEVWFDQSELRGGDAWDQKIRKQIQECALFLPVISATTQTRLEGYFRIEWNLAAQRTHAMAAARPFLIPVVIDATRDAEAHVPLEFKAVQWTRLLNVETAQAFVARVQALLASGLVAGTRDLTATRGVVVEEKPGDRLGHYRLIEKIGEGGCGTVWQAEQEHPVRRRVALKVIKLGMDTKEVVGRFEAERQALALMDHPNIAQVYDAGITDTGRPFFVMELVRGVSITTFCDGHKLSTEARLGLFIQVCHAVQHAHQKGIIHRDLKPSNILVALTDDVPAPKVIDFGIAKATGGRLTDQTLYTAVQQFIGTPAYMSPEQAQVSAVDIDTRSDIYSLGVLLYELLTGRTPFETAELLNAGLDEIRRQIREVDPPRPSTLLSTMQGEALHATAERQQTVPPKLITQIRGDLDWIVMRCLEKDRARRYETANGLALDLQRHLRHEPVSAAAPTWRYQFGKFARRNRVALATAAAFALILVAATIISLWQAGQARRAERAAEAARDQAVVERRRADDEAATARAVTDFLQNDLLRQASSRFQTEAKFEADPNLTVRQALERAAKRIGDRFKDQPLVEASIRMAIGDACGDIGEPKKALEQYERALALRTARLGPEHPDTLHSKANFAWAHVEAGDRHQAVQLHEETLKLRKAKLGPEHPDTLVSMNNLAEAYTVVGNLSQALPLLEETLELRKTKQGPEHPSTLSAMNNLAEAYHKSGKLDQALPLFEETLKLKKAKLGLEHPSTVTSIVLLAFAYKDAGKFDQSLRLFEDALKLRTATLGPEHPGTLISMGELASAYWNAGKREQALPLLEENLRVLKAKLGPQRAGTIKVMNNLALAYQGVGKMDQALVLLEETLASYRASMGPEHPYTLIAMHNLAVAFQEAGKLDRALPCYEETVKLRKAKLGPEHPDTLITTARLGVALASAKRNSEAKAVLVEAVAGLQRAELKSLVGVRKMLRASLQTLTQICTESGEAEQAARWQQALADLDQAYPPPP